ncbi:unnamed protein product [Blepharisma stoltei]|uniref:Uncharacterized protein n=1 Tax=Blepharisma stoltei TaxID=1481888 RepID=A0AAU9JDB6_9CILI|nr:unnamed protein product [Blepharisma stoltei]
MPKETNMLEFYLEVSYFIEYISQFCSKNLASRLSQVLGNFYYSNKNYRKSIEHFIKSINYHIERFQKKSLLNEMSILDDSLL